MKPEGSTNCAAQEKHPPSLPPSFLPSFPPYHNIFRKIIADMHPSSLHSFPDPCPLDGGGVRAAGPFPSTNFFGVNAEFEYACVGEEMGGVRA